MPINKVDITPEEELTDEEATELHWFLLDCFSTQLFGKPPEMEVEPADT